MTTFVQAAERVLVRWHHVIAMPAATGDAPSSDYFELVGFPGVFVAIKVGLPFASWYRFI